ncbi:hypothetical protein PISL3812_06924 [Talaromyces islandicus]|uniref:AAA+ ATPase domain-containing protein n=1 Tax=Talaromyces islandicus TaxID=28573 RepID=A0A0U1M2V2_TALIS|nr:hypothetical protein PISL3812_06924 [Talaromyces islandicus]
MTTVTHDDYTVAWICALPLEAAAARSMLDRTHSSLPIPSTDSNAYQLGELNGHYIVIASLPNGIYGKVSAATVVSRMRSTFPQLQCGLMVGIGGGVPGKSHDIRLGDIVVSKPAEKHSGVIQYDYGKAIQDGQFELTGTLNKPPQLLLTHIGQLEAKQMTDGEDALSHIVDEALIRNPNMQERFSPPAQHTDFLFHSSYRHIAGEVPVSRPDANLMNNKKARHWIVPLARNPKFVGRQDEITTLEELITMQDSPRKIAITGLGGVGKTQVALELAHRIRDRHKECSILGLRDVNPAEVKEQVKSYLSSKRAGKWLLVFDNADDAEMWFAASHTASPLEDFIPDCEDGCILFTTRNRKLAMKLAPFNIISIPDVDKETAVRILDKTLAHEDLLRDTTTTATLLEQLAFLPLAITQASAYIIKNSIDLSTYLALL